MVSSRKFTMKMGRKSITDNGSYAKSYEEYEYDTEGRQTAVIKPVYKNSIELTVPVKTTSVYNDDNQIVNVIFNDVATVSDASRQDVTFTFTYKEDGSRDTVTYPSGMEKSFDDFDSEIGFTPPETRNEVATYNTEGLLGSIIKPEGTLNYSYDPFGSLASVSYYGHTVSYDYDFFGRLQTARDGSSSWNYSYNSVGKKERVANLTEGTTELFEYDSLGRTEKKIILNADSSILFEIDYIIGDDGNRIGAIETRGTEVVKWDYEYDELGRLTAEKRDYGNDSSYERNVSYTYDADSNRKTEVTTGESKEYFYAAGTQQLTEIKRNSTTYETYTWTASGEMASKAEANGDKEIYSWQEGALISVEFQDGTNDGLTITYDYDESRTLVARKVTDQYDVVISHEEYLVDYRNPIGYSQVVATRDGQTRMPIEVNTYSDEIKSQTQSKAGTHQFLHTDSLGSIRSLTSYETSEQYDYTAFGSKLEGSGSLTNYAFTGQVADSSTNLQYHRARWLDTQSGRWNSSDPVFDFPNNWGNQYSYAGLNPARLFDKSGKSLIELTVAQHYQIILASSAVGAYIGIKETLRTGSIAIGAWEGLKAFAISMIAGVLLLGVPILAAHAAFIGIMLLTYVSGMHFSRYGFNERGWRLYISDIIIPILIFVVFHTGASFLLKSVSPQPFITPSKAALANPRAPLWERVGAKPETDASGEYVLRGIASDHPAYQKALQHIVEPWGGIQKPQATGHTMGYTRNSGLTSWTTEMYWARFYAKPLNPSDPPGIILRTKVPDGKGVYFDSHYEGQVLVEGIVRNAEFVEFVEYN